MEIQHADLDRELDRELDVVLGAMRLVASGGARRTIVASWLVVSIGPDSRARTMPRAMRRENRSSPNS